MPVMARERIILASASPRRRELLAQIYADFDIVPSPLPEPDAKPAQMSPEQWVERVALFKAVAVARGRRNAWVLGADTIVACAGEILGKPRDLADARRMLEMQARVASDVLTGVALVRMAPASQEFTRVATTRVWMRDDAAQRAAYLASGDWEGKAGAYGLQDVGDRLVTRIDGSFSNVVGLPLEMTAALLSAAGLPTRTPPENAAGYRPSGRSQGE